jgi:hypothetical protein
VVVGRVSLGLEGSAGRVFDGVGCIGIVRDNVISSGGGKVLIMCPWGKHMGLGGVNFGGRGGMGGNCGRVWKG